MDMINYTYPFSFEGDYEVIPAPDSVAVQQPFGVWKKEEDVAGSSSPVGMKRSTPANHENIKKPCHHLPSGLHL